MLPQIFLIVVYKKLSEHGIYMVLRDRSVKHTLKMVANEFADQAVHFCFDFGRWDGSFIFQKKVLDFSLCGFDKLYLIKQSLIFFQFWQFKPWDFQFQHNVKLIGFVDLLVIKL